MVTIFVLKKIYPHWALFIVEPLLWDTRYPRDSSIQGTQNLVAKKCLHNLCVCYLY